MKIISLGWGVQSFTLAAMVALGELEPVDFAIHADTTHESALTYEFASRWTPWLQKRGVVVVVVVASHEKKNIIDKWGGYNFPHLQPAQTVTGKSGGSVRTNGKLDQCVNGLAQNSNGAVSRNGPQPLSNGWVSRGMKASA